MELILDILKKIYIFIKDNAIFVIAIVLVICLILNMITSLLLIFKKLKKNRNIPQIKALEEENHFMFQSDKMSEMTSDNDDETNEIPF